jgi:myo-inositol-1(or 4)-monophosphatase
MYRNLCKQAFARYSKAVNNSTYLTTAIQAAQAASKLHQFYAGSDLGISTKSNDIDLVTKVDKLCEEKIREIILQAHPDQVVLGEEGGQSEGNASHRWIVDPLDGTVNYAHGFPFYSVSIGLEIDGVMEVGVVIDSVRNEMFTATRGGGAFCNGTQISVSSEATLKKCLLATGFPYEDEGLKKNLEVFARVHQKVRAIRRPGSAALDLCYVACGRIDGFWELKLNAWDVAAGMLLVQEAGGTVTGVNAEPYTLGDKTIIASNGHVHGKLLHALELGTANA